MEHAAMRPRQEQPSARPLERLVFDGPELQIGTFFAAAGRPCFRDSGPIERHIVVFPRTSVWIQHAGHEPFLSDPNHVCYYNRGQVYWRRDVGGQADRCEWFAPRGGLLRELLRHVDAKATARHERPFRFRQGPSDTRSVHLERLLLRHVQGGAPVDELFVGETACVILARLLAAAHAQDSGGRRPAPRMSANHAGLATAARRLLAHSFTAAWSLSGLAARLGVSQFHLCRVFRAVTGRSLHAYRSELRLRAALERVPEESDLTSLALDLGYSSHSHFTAAFRRAFGITPREWRATASGARLQALAESLGAGREA